MPSRKKHRNMRTAAAWRCDGCLLSAWKTASREVEWSAISVVGPSSSTSTGHDLNYRLLRLKILNRFCTYWGRPIPRYEFFCRTSKKTFSRMLALVHWGEGEITCPHCGIHQVEQVW